MIIIMEQYHHHEFTQIDISVLGRPQEQAQPSTATWIGVMVTAQCSASDSTFAATTVQVALVVRTHHQKVDW
jgi:hypothetical protein